jgi:hypothetical protein
MRFRRARGSRVKVLVRMSGILGKEESSIGLGPKLRANQPAFEKIFQAKGQFAGSYA